MEVHVGKIYLIRKCFKDIKPRLKKNQKNKQKPVSYSTLLNEHFNAVVFSTIADQSELQLRLKTAVFKN